MNTIKKRTVTNTLNLLFIIIMTGRLFTTNPKEKFQLILILSLFVLLVIIQWISKSSFIRKQFAKNTAIDVKTGEGANAVKSELTSWAVLAIGLACLIGSFIH